MLNNVLLKMVRRRYRKGRGVFRMLKKCLRKWRRRGRKQKGGRYKRRGRRSRRQGIARAITGSLGTSNLYPYGVAAMV